MKADSLTLAYIGIGLIGAGAFLLSISQLLKGISIAATPILKLFKWLRRVGKRKVTEDQRVEAIKNKKAMEALIATEGWKLLEGFGKGQVGPRENQVMLVPTKDVMEQEFMKGEVQGIKLLLETPGKLIEESKAIIDLANEQEVNGG